MTTRGWLYNKLTGQCQHTHTARTVAESRLDVPTEKETAKNKKNKHLFAKRVHVSRLLSVEEQQRRDKWAKSPQMTHNSPLWKTAIESKQRLCLLHFTMRQFILIRPNKHWTWRHWKQLIHQFEWYFWWTVRPWVNHTDAYSWNTVWPFFFFFLWPTLTL